MRLPKFVAIATVAALVAAPPAVEAQDVIVSAVSGVINSGGPGFGALSSTFDQSGLLSGYTSGVTLFDTFLASGPLHGTAFADEWFSNIGTTSASVTYNLGSVMNINRLALWNDEGVGAATFDLFGSVNGVDFFALALGLIPTDHTTLDPYLADVFGWAGQNLQFVRMDISGCPQTGINGGIDFCAIGEVAFAAGQPQVPVPEPGTFLLMLSGLLGLGFVSYRRRETILA